MPGIDGKTIQLGTGRAESIGDVFRAACSALGVDAEVTTDTERIRPAQSEVMVLQSDPSLAAALLDWKAETNLELGLRLTAEWMKGELGRFRAGPYVV